MYPQQLIPYFDQRLRLSQSGVQQYYSYQPYVHNPNVLMQSHHPSRANGSTPHLQSAQLNSSAAGSVTGAPSTQLPHQQSSLMPQLTGMQQLGAQGSHHQMGGPMYSMPPSMHRQTPDNKKRQRNPLPIIDPNSGEEVITNNTKSAASSHSSSSNTHSAALKIEAPMSPPIAASPAGNAITIESDVSDIPLVQSDFESMLNVADPAYSCESEVTNVDEQPHTPIVSANADGPSVDIPPKQSKNVKRT